MLKLVANLFEDNELKNIENITSEQRADKVKYLLKKLSRDDFKISINADKLNNIDDLYIFINEEEMFVWSFQSEHFYFNHTDDLSDSDWRAGHLDNLLNSNIDDNFKRLMGEFFNPFKVVSEKMRDDKNFGYRYSREFKPGKGLVREEIKNTNNISQIIDLMPYLLRQKLPETFLNKAFEQKTYQKEIFNILLANPNIDVNLQNKNKDTALYLAAKNGSQEIATLLLAKENINVNLQDIDGNTALHLGLQENKLDVVKFLLAKENINVNLQDIDGNTALHFAIQKNNLEIVKLILAKENIDVNLQNKNRETALHLIAANKEGKNITLQLLYKENINTKLYNNKFETALDIAKKINNYEVSEALEYFIRTHK